MDELLKRLSDAYAVSGNEDSVRGIIKEEASKYADAVNVDSIGNVIAYKTGNTGKKKIMLAAHMDEVGLMVSYIDDSGYLRFKTVGGIDQRVLLAKRVKVGKACIPGVIGVKAIHLQAPAERGNVIPLSAMYIDVGAVSAANSGVKIGDYIMFDTEFDDFGDGKMKGKALDDRIGCRVLLDILKNRYDDDIYCCFTVQEEVGLRGAGVAAFNVDPDMAIILEATTAADVPDVSGDKTVTVLGGGVAVSHMDAASVGDKKLVCELIKTAEDNNIPHQIKRMASGGNDAGAINTSRDGILTAVLSVPTRYIHSPVSVADYSDYESMRSLVDAYLKNRG